MSRDTPTLDEDPFADSALDKTSTELLLLDRMARFRRDPLNWMHEIALYVSGTGWRSYDQIIGQQCFYPGYTDKIKTAVLSSTLLNERLKTLVDTRLQLEESEYMFEGLEKERVKQHRREEIEASLADIVDQMTDQMMCKMESKTYLRTAFYCCTQLLTRAYRGIYVSRPEVDRLREVSSTAARNNQSIIFLPRHSSHIDYVTLHLVCYRLGLTLPVVVAGDNLNFPLVGSFLQAVGAMWIRRSFDSATDPLYTAVVQAYLDSLLQNGYNLECFIEGTRSRTGKLLNPKFGILNFLLDSIQSGRTKDAFICPVSLQYDKVIEVDSYTSELLGIPKQKENLADFVSASSLLGLNFGRIDCRFKEPWSLKLFIQEQLARQPESQPGTQRSNGADNLRFRLLRTLGYRVLSDINEVSVVMPTALVGTVLLTLRGRGVGMRELVRRVDWLCDRIRLNGGNVADFHGRRTQYIVEAALQVLGPNLVGNVEGLAESTYFAVDRFQVSFYRNMVIHLFLSEALIAVAMNTNIKKGGNFDEQRMPEDELLSTVGFLSQVFRGEFIFAAGQGLQHNMDRAVEKLVLSQVLEVTTSNGHRKVGLTQFERQNGRENFDFYCSLIWPFCDGAWLAAVSFLCLLPPCGSLEPWVDLTKALKVAQVLGRTLYHQGELSYFEAINTQVLRNAYTRFEEEQIVAVRKSADGKGASSVRLTEDWMPERDSETGMVRPEGRLWNFVDRISQCRREGKGRHDGATLSRRVLPLLESLGNDLFNETTTNVQTNPESVPKKKSVKRRSRL